MKTHRIQNFNEEQNNELMREALDWIDEKREKTYLRIEAYKSRIQVGYFWKVKIRNF